MDDKPPLDRSLFAPILLGCLSVAGIILVLLALRLSAALGTIQVSPTNTPVKYQYLGTEPVIAQPTEAPPPEEPSPVVTQTPTEFSLAPAPTITISTPVPPTATHTRVTNTATTAPLEVTYDNADVQFTYSGNWLPQFGVNGTYKNTLHISSTIGDSVQLIFYGQKFRLSFQAGPSLGTVAIRLDSTDFVLEQSAVETRNSEWESPVLTLANHLVTITHISGGSINIDSITIIDISTPTPTATPTE